MVINSNSEPTATEVANKLCDSY